MRRARTLLAAAVLLALLAGGTACSDGGDERGAGPGPDGEGGEADPTGRDDRPDIDPRRYYEDYQVAAGEDMAGASGGAPPAAAPDAQSSRDGAESGVAADSFAATTVPSEPGEPPLPEPNPPTEPVEPAITDDNTFADPGVNPFVATAGDPESTFALDVDTGSFSVGRTFLTEGLRPDPASVRPEEWVNAFDYDDPAPSDGDLGITVEGEPAPFAEDGTRLVRVGVRARDVAVEDRPPAHLTLVVDTSGSMDIRERLGLVRSTMALLALQLRDDDTVSVVTYGDSSNVLLAPTPAAEAEEIIASIDQLVPGGSTNMEAGLRAGYEQARAVFEPEAINTVVLASDGVANAGITGTDPLADLIRTEGEDGIRLVTVGYGMGNYNDELMEQLADRGDGFYSYVDTYEEAERLFTTELTSTLTVVAEDARAQVTFDPEAVESYRLVGYENRALDDEDFRDDTVDAGELGAGHAVSALYEVRLADGGPDELGTVSLRHTPEGGGEAVEQDLAITRDDIARDAGDASAGVGLAGAVAAFAELLADHPAATERGTTLDGVADLVDGLGGDEEAVAATGRPGVAELAELVELARSAAPGPVETLGEG